MRPTQLLCLLLPLGLGACASLTQGLRLESRSNTAWASHVDAVYAGPRCQEVLHPIGAAQNTSKEPTSDDLQVLLATCDRKERTNHRDRLEREHLAISPRNIHQIHPSFDDRRPDILDAALAAFWVAKYRVTGDIYQPRGVDAPYYRPPTPAQLGLASLYMSLVDPAALRQRLATTQAPPAAQEVFLTNVEGARQELSDAVSQLTDAERALVVDVPRQVLERRRVFFQEYQDLYDNLDALLDALSSDPGAHMASLEELLATFMKRCKRHTCVQTPLYATLVQEILAIHVASQATLEVRAASEPYRHKHSLRETFAQDVEAALLQRGRVMDFHERRYRHARKSGLSDEEARGMLRDDLPLAFRVNQHTWHNLRTSLPDYTSALGSGRIPTFSGVVARVGRPAKGVQQITFRTDSYKAREVYGCKKTDKPIRIWPDGRIEYERKGCKSRVVTRKRTPTPPVLLPLEHASGLRPGDIISGVVSKKQGRIFRTVRAKKLVQLYGYDIEPVDTKK